MSLQFQTTIENYLNNYNDLVYGHLQLLTNFTIDYIQNFDVSESFVESIKQTIIDLGLLEKTSNVLEIETLESKSKMISSYINRIVSIKHTSELSNFFLLQERELTSKLTVINNRISELNDIIKSIDGIVDLLIHTINHTYLCRGDTINKEESEDKQETENKFKDVEIQQYADLISNFVRDIRKALQ